MSGVRAAVLQLGRLVGLEMYGTCSVQAMEIVKGLGATPIDYRNSDFVQEIRRLTDDGVDAVFDGIGGDNLWRSREALREGGHVVVYGFQAQLHLAEIRARAGLLSARTALVNASRGWVKSYGERLHKCSTQQFTREITSGLSAGLQEALPPLLREVESLSEGIKEYDRRIAKMANERYPETALLKQVKGVGDLIATTYVLTLEDPHRFRKSRDAGCFVGLQPGRRNSGSWTEFVPNSRARPPSSGDCD